MAGTQKTLARGKRGTIEGANGNRIPILYPPTGRVKRTILSIARYLIRKPQGRYLTTNGLRFFVQSLGGIGNTLMCTPLLSEIRRLYPDCTIDLYTTSSAAQLLASNSSVNSIIVDRTRNSRRGRRIGMVAVLGYLSAIRKLRKALLQARSPAVFWVEQQGCCLV